MAHSATGVPALESGLVRILAADSGDPNGAAWVEPDSKGGSRFIWTVDLLPNELASQVEQMMNTGIAVVRQTMETAKAA
jgi:hypothetical protein